MPDGLSLRSEGEVRGAFIAKGAVGPANAQPGKYFGVETKPFENLVRRGVVKTVAP